MLSNRNIAIGSFLLLLAFMQVMWAVPSPVPTNQLFMMLGMVLVLIRCNGDEVKVNKTCVFFLGAIVLSILTNHIPVFFKPWQRFMQFLFLAIAASPLFESVEINRMRRHMFLGVLWACGIISALSLLGYFMGFGQYIAGIINGYMGVTPHPNFLGMYAFITMIWMAALFFRCTEMWERVLIGSLWGGCVILLLVCASRASLAMGLFGSLIVVYLRLRHSAGKLMTAGFVLAGLVFFSLPFLLPYAETMLKKDANNANAEESLTATRGLIWELRMMELEESPIVGVGAFACDVNLPSADIFYDANTGSIEQGSSYLGLLSQLGWLGFIAFLMMAVPIVWKTVLFAFRQQTPYAQLMLSLIVAIAGHMVFEGYAITAGAVQCVVLWLVLGAASQCDKVADYPIFWEDEENPPITPEEYECWREESELE